MSRSNRNEAAARPLPVAHQRDASADRHANPAEERRHPSGMRLQAAVVRPVERDERDPYADVPCTD